MIRAMAEHRIVSLIASATEIVTSLGFEDQLVGRSHECDFPPSVERLPVCSEARIDVDGSSREIDDRVKSALTDATSIYRVFEDVLHELQPTIIITQAQCEVCAVSLKDVERAVCNLVDSKPRVVSLEPMRLADVWKDIITVGEALGARKRAEEFVKAQMSCMQAISGAIEKQLGSPESSRPTIACIEWIDPLMAAGNWVPELVEIAGGTDVLGRAGRHSGYLTFEQLAQADPDVIAVSACGWGIARTRAEMAPLAKHPGWASLKAVRTDRVYLTDGNWYFNRPGPRLVESAQILGEILHPQVFAPSFEGRGWVRFDPAD